MFSILQFALSLFQKNFLEVKALGFKAYFWNSDGYINEKYRFDSCEILTAYLNDKHYNYLSLYDTMLSKNVRTITYHVGGEVYVMNHNNQVGFVKGEMCSPGIATQAEDLIAAGAQELIHVGFAGGRVGTRIGDVVITDGAFNDTAVAGLYGCNSEIVETSRALTDSFCMEMGSKGITYHRGYHWTTDAGYVETNWRIKYFEDKGALCVEMEGAGLFSVAKFRSCHATGIYVISDSGEGDDWDLRWGEEVLETSISKVIDAIAKKG